MISSSTDKQHFHCLRMSHALFRRGTAQALVCQHWVWLMLDGNGVGNWTCSHNPSSLVSTGTVCSNLQHWVFVSLSFFFFFIFLLQIYTLEESLSSPEAGRTPWIQSQNPWADGHRFWLTTVAVVEHYGLWSHPGASERSPSPSAQGSERLPPQAEVQHRNLTAATVQGFAPGPQDLHGQQRKQECTSLSASSVM